MVDLAGATVLELAEANPADIVNELETVAHRPQVAPWAGLLFAALAGAALAVGLPLLVVCVPLLLGVPLTVWLVQWDKVRRAVVTFYDVEGQPATAFEGLVAAHLALTSTNKAWNIEAFGPLWTTHQRKRHAGASALNERSDAALTTRGPKVLVTNILVPTLDCRRRSVYLLPERILVREGRQFAAVPYDSLGVEVNFQQFIEEGYVPRDSQQVATTWRYVNKDGSRDRRYNDNRPLPVMLYGRLILSNADGFLMVWDFSQPRLAQDFAQAVQAMAVTVNAVTQPAQRAPAQVTRTDAPAHVVAAPPGLQPFDLWGKRGWHGQEVAGESHHSDAILRILGGRPSWDWAEVITPALLIPEPSNPYDPNAVAVVVGGNVVGYLPREDAARYQPVLASLFPRSFVPQASAQIRGGLKHDDTRGTIFIGSVRLDLGEPHLLVPANLPPSARHVLLPPGRVVQVTGEEAYVDMLAPLAGNAGQRWVYGTLHEVTEQTARTSRSLVEVQVDGSPGGRLTQQMSLQLLPVIRYFGERDVVTAVRAMLKRGPAKTDITLQVAPAAELAEPVLASLPVMGEPQRR